MRREERRELLWDEVSPSQQEALDDANFMIQI